MNICKIGFSRILLFFRNVVDMSIDLDIYFIYMFYPSIKVRQYAVLVVKPN